jgi:hypothetical protein
VAVEGAVPAGLAAIDPYAEAGPKGALARSAVITVEDGSLDLELLHHIQNPMLAGIEIVSLDAQP